uniref:Uncharacterized protein n=1 Tax=Cucumis melo TaxID=3656 RepID=A0A9I9DMY1_CUCME
MAETVDIIRNAMDFANDQLKVIPKWSNTQRQVEDEYITECMNQLQDILELSSRDRVWIIRIIIRS